MATAIGITTIKAFIYRDVPGEEWSNKYWFTGTPPTDDASWKTLIDALVNAEVQCYASTSKVVRAYGYNDDTPGAAAVALVDYALLGENHPGTLVQGAGDHTMAGDQVGEFFAKTNRKNSRGKWIYLRKYMHDGYTGADKDKVSTLTETAYNNFAGLLQAGFVGGTHVWRSQKQVEVITLAEGSPWVSTRTLKRRGKRP